MSETSLADWLGEEADDDAPARSPRRRSRLLVLATVPWVIVGVLAAALAARGTASAPVTVAGSSRTEPTVTGSTPAQPTPRATPSARDVAAPAVADATASQRRVATPAIRAALAASGASLRLVDDVTIERLHRVGEARVATVSALVLDRRPGGNWAPPRLRRFAVPLLFAGTVATVVDDPWALPVRQEPSPRWLPSHDVDAAAAAVSAILAAGYRDVTDAVLATADDLPGVVRVRCSAIAPGAQDRARHTVWVTGGRNGRVLGADAS